MSVIERHPTDHVVIAGFGSSGSEAAVELIRRGADPDTIVVVDDNAEALRSAEALGVTVMEGNATRDAALEAARASTAGALIVAAGRDHTSILIALTARRIAPMLPISAVVRSRDNEAIARQAGANTVIDPTSFGGLLLAGSTHGAHLADYMADLAASHGRVALRERDVKREEVGPECIRHLDLGCEALEHAIPRRAWTADRGPGGSANLSQRRALVIAALLRDQGIAPVARPAAGQRFSLTPGTAVTP